MLHVQAVEKKKSFPTQFFEKHQSFLPAPASDIQLVAWH
jgi:hypothetical protein